MMRWTWLCLIAACLNVTSIRGQEPARVIPDTEQGNPEPLPPAEALASMKVPAGFRVNLFASEPEILNPIGLSWDARGRLWIAENFTYAEHTLQFDLSLTDRVLIFEDADGDGRSDRRTVFTDDVQRLTSVEVGQGGVWLMCPPDLLFVPDADGDDRPDGPARVVLDGFDVPPENHHNFANGLRFGPDGWLYGRCGATAPGRVGPPGATKEDRIPLNGGIWRYHPDRGVVETICHGTTNPWGHDWNRLGELFFINTVNGHLWHAIPGAHLDRIHTIDPNSRVYQTMDQHADHWHWDNSKDWTDSRNVTGEHDRLGGGHAHSGMMIYQGEGWPEPYQDRLFTLNFHGRRVNVDRLDREGSGYFGHHEPDFLFAGDTWFRGIDMAQAPDGSVMILDWSDTGECHENTGVHRNSGRIYRVSHEGRAKASPVGDLRGLSNAELLGFMDQPNVWLERQARRVLVDRKAAGKLNAAVGQGLVSRIHSATSAEGLLRSLWTLYAIDAAEPALLRSLLDHTDEAARAWGIRLLTDGWPLDTVLGPHPKGVKEVPADLMDQFRRMAREDDSGLVRLALASTLQRLPVKERPGLAGALLGRAEDRDDHNLPLLVWYGLIPVSEADRGAVVDLALEGTWPTTRRLMARQIAESAQDDPESLECLVSGLATKDVAEPMALLDGLRDGLRGVRKLDAPTSWLAAASRLGSSNEPGLVDAIRELGVVFGDGRALEEVRRLALDDEQDLETRKSALATLIESRPEDLREICTRLLSVRFLNTTAVRGLALFDDPEIGKSLALEYRSFHPTERPAVLETLVARRSSAEALLDEMRVGRIPRTDLGAFQARQIRSLGDPDLTSKLEEVWGVVRESAADRAIAIASLKQQLDSDSLGKADLSRGRLAFQQVCASCHRLYGQGGEIGPDLTGSGRDNIDYLLENILEPGMTVNADYRMVVAALVDGRVLNGIVKSRNDRTLALQTQNELVVLPLEEVEEVQLSDQSLMPDGLLNTLEPDQVRDLFGYLMQRSQVPLPPDAEAAP